MAHIQLIGVSEIKSPEGKISKLPYALPILISQLQKTRHTFNVIDTHLHHKSALELIQEMADCQAQVYGISAFSHNYMLVKELSAKLRENNKNAVIICGGLLARNDRVLMDCTEVDIAVTSADGEFILIDILDALDESYEKLCDVRGITFKTRAIKKDIVQTIPRPVMSQEEFAQLDMPAYKYFDREIHEIVANLSSRTDIPVRAFPLLTMRGCPFSCTFCGHMYGSTFLRKSWPKYFDEIEYLQKRYNIEGFYSFDTNMFLNTAEADEYCNEYQKRNCTAKMVIELRPTFGDYRMFKKLYENGVRVILFGFESGSQYMLDRMKKQFILSDMKRIIKDALNAGMMVSGNFIFGTPGENKKTIKETAEFLLLLEKWFWEQDQDLKGIGEKSASKYGWSILIPSPTSELYAQALREGVIVNEEQYLASLANEDSFKLLKGSEFKISLAESGGDANMSQFKSKKSLIAYVKFTLALVKAKALLVDVRYLLRNIHIFIGWLLRAVGFYIQFYCLNLSVLKKYDRVAK